MLRLIVYLLFILSVAFASAGVVLSSRLRNKYRSGPFSTLMYFQVFIFTFGFYGIWGQLVIKTFLSEYVSIEAIERFTDISVLLGLPFLVFAWLMLIKFSLEIAGRKSNGLFVFFFLLVNFLIILGIGLIISGKSGIKPLSLIRYYYIILNLFYSLSFLFIMLFTGKNKPMLKRKERLVAGYTMFAVVVLQCTGLCFYDSEPGIGLIFIFTFFAGNSFLPVYLTYGTKINLMSEDLAPDISFDDFCKRFDVSQRESDIIREICNGLSNKEISDKLFISLQTVKDHSHRIYIKTNVRSRAQLMNLVKKNTL
jgi:DNA-binding CsgD family transcriptional regulator